MIIFNNDEVTDVVARPPNDMYVMKNVLTENLQLSIREYELISTNHVRFV